MWFDPASNGMDLGDKNIVITGGTAGLGKETVIQLAAQNPASIIFTGRNKTAADALISECKDKFPNVSVTFVPCDLNSLASVQEAAKHVTASVSRLDLLLCIAGIMATPPSLTIDGYESQFGINFLGHALLMKLLLPLLRSSEPAAHDTAARIILYTSKAAENMPLPAGGIDFQAVKTDMADASFPGSWQRYAQSKLAVLLYAKALARHVPNVTTVVVHPGVAWTDLVNNLDIWSRLLVWSTTFNLRRSPTEVAWNGIWAATAPIGPSDGEVQSGTYYRPVGEKGPTNGFLSDEALADKLWEWTQGELYAW